MTDETNKLTTEEMVEMLMMIYGHSEDEARRLAADPDTEVYDVIIDGKPYVGKSIFDTE